MDIKKQAKSKVEVATDYSIAFSSPDHILPVGVKNDNSTDLKYINEVEKYFGNKKINALDIGCAGGQLAVDFHKRGHFSVGIEGSDYALKNNLHNWPKYYNEVLFNADVTKPYEVRKNGERVLFDLISAWEVVEHIKPSDLESFFSCMISNLKPDGIFVASVNEDPDVRRDQNGKLVIIHQSVFPRAFWEKYIFSKLSDCELLRYPFINFVRKCTNSFFIGMKRKD